MTLCPEASGILGAEGREGDQDEGNAAYEISDWHHAMDVQSSLCVMLLSGAEMGRLAARCQTR